jgi:anthranilate phosphoribosyltransferase
MAESYSGRRRVKMIKEAISTIISGKSLASDEAALVMEEIMEGRVTPAQLGSFLTALRIKGETAEEITGFAGVMREKATPVVVTGPVIDIVGTGGDGSNTFNISTASAFVAAGAGLKVAKHGNRAASSQCGSADVLEELGVKIELSADNVRRCIEEVGIGFMFAQSFHPSMKYAASPRREIGIRTVFNILGPLTNPAGARFQVLGVADKTQMDKIASALEKLGSLHALVVRGEDGLDEITITGPTLVHEVKDRIIKHYLIRPEDFGLHHAGSLNLKGGTASENAGTLRAILTGESGPRRDVVLLNAAAALYAGDRVANLQDGVTLAAEIIDSKRALAKLDGLIEFTRDMGKA